MSIHHGPPRVIYSTLASCTDRAPDVPYRWRRTPGWDPAKAGGVPQTSGARGPAAFNSAQVERGNARRARFAELRAAGVGVVEAGREVGVGRSSARDYERWRKTGIWQR
jgi:hypothetical protein